MSLPVWVGVILTIMALVTFSGWFYESVAALRELVLDDQFFAYRIASASLISMVILVAAFWGIATINECQSETREGIFANLRCEEYLNLRTAAEQIFERQEPPVDQPFE